MLPSTIKPKPPSPQIQLKDGLVVGDPSSQRNVEKWKGNKLEEDPMDEKITKGHLMWGGGPRGRILGQNPDKSLKRFSSLQFTEIEFITVQYC